MNLSHVKKISDIPKYCGPTFMGTFTILFNSNRVTRKEAIHIAATDGYSPYVLCIPQTQLEGLFYDRAPAADPNMEETPK